MVQLFIGDMLCEVCMSGMEMGKKVVVVMDVGNLVIDEIVIGLICEKFEQGVEGGFIFDGFLCILKQVDVFVDFLEEMGQLLDVVIEF